MKAIILCLFFFGHGFCTESPIESGSGYGSEFGSGSVFESVSELGSASGAEPGLESGAVPEVESGSGSGDKTYESEFESGSGSAPEPNADVKLPPFSSEIPEELKDRLNRAPREAPAPSKPDNQPNPEDCPFKCTDGGKQKFADDKDFQSFLKQLEKPLRFKDQFSPKYLKQYCQMIQYTEDCTKLCPESKYKTFILEGLEMQSLCKDKRMLDESILFNQVFNDKLDECNKNCSKYGNNLARIVNDNEPSLNRSEILEISCNYMLCFTECEHDSLLSKVGAENTKYYERLVGQSINFTRATAQVNGEQLELPEVCLKVEKLGEDEYDVLIDNNDEDLPPAEDPVKPTDD